MIYYDERYVSCTVNGQAYTYHFTGVTGIGHNLALNLNNASAQGTDIVKGARNLPDQVTLSVIETDAEHSPGWSGSLAFMEYIPVTEENAADAKANDNSSTRKNTGGRQNYVLLC